MKKLVVVFVALFIGTMAFSQTKIGGNLLFASESNFGLGVKSTIGITEVIEVSPSINYYFSESVPGVSVTTLSFNADGHYLFPVQEKLNLYPLVGLNLFYVSVSSSYTSYAPSASRFGVNLGGGASYQFTDKLTGISEMKMMLNSGSQFVLSVGVLYNL